MQINVTPIRKQWQEVLHQGRNLWFVDAANIALGWRACCILSFVISKPQALGNTSQKIISRSVKWQIKKLYVLLHNFKLEILSWFEDWAERAGWGRSGLCSRYEWCRVFMTQHMLRVVNINYAVNIYYLFISGDNFSLGKTFSQEFFFSFMFLFSCCWMVL